MQAPDVENGQENSVENEMFQTESPLVQKSFGAAAKDYDRVAVLQYEIATRLLERLELITLRPLRILDLGSGTGRGSGLLARRYRKAGIIQADLAVDMLRQSRSSRRRLFSRHNYLCTDAERLPLAAESVDMVFSNLMLQWCNDPGQVFEEVRRVLRPEGLFIFSTFGPDTLAELRDSWRAVDADVHVNSFADMHDIGDALVRCGFAQPVMESETLTLVYDDGYSMMRELKAIGAHNVNRGRRRTLTGKGRIKRMLEAYESKREGGKLPAGYEVIYGHAWSPAANLGRASRDGTATFPLSKLKIR